MGLSECEQERLNMVKQHKERSLSWPPRRFVPAAVRAKYASVFSKLQTVPGVEAAKDAGAAVLEETAESAGKS
ncbi:hypothetical protein [Mycolicibacterium sp. HS_4_1]